MNQWQRLLADLKDRGWSQEKVAAEVGSAQSTIADLKTGKTQSPSYDLGIALHALRDSKKLAA